MAQNILTINTLINQLLTLGVKPNGTLLVHTAFSHVKPIENGPLGLITALRQALGPEGTLVMPSMFWKDDLPFDPQTSPCPDMGIVADIFWRLDGVLRSNTHGAFAAVGPHAAYITAPHPIDPPHGLNSPVGRVYELGGQVLLLGIDQTANTTIHLAEELSGVRYRQDKYVTVLENGRPTRFDYKEIDHCCQKFTLVDEWLEQEQCLRIGRTGHATARLVQSRDIVRLVTAQLQQNETVFLHPQGFHQECDAAWASLANQSV